MLMFTFSEIQKKKKVILRKDITMMINPCSGNILKMNSIEKYYTQLVLWLISCSGVEKAEVQGDQNQDFRID